MPSSSITSSAAHGSDSGSGQRRRHVRLTDRKLMDVATRAAADADWDALVRRAKAQAAAPGQGRDFAVSVAKADGRTSVAAAGVVACSVAEMQQVLRPASNELYASTMRELHGGEFIYGAIVHCVDDEASESLGLEASRLGASQLEASRLEASRSGGGRPLGADQRRRALSKGGVLVDLDPSDVDVKTVTFAKRHLLARSEQWCYVDALHPVDTGRSATMGFALSRTSLHPDDVFLGKTKAHVSALTDINVKYAVLPVSRSRANSDSKKEGGAAPLVQVVFLAEFDQGQLRTTPPRRGMFPSKKYTHIWSAVSERALVHRLKDMAASTQLLSQIVRHRRLTAQVFVNLRAVNPPNSRCVCCTRLLTTILGRNKKQCHLCGYFVCESCSSRHEIQRGRVKRFMVRICEHCMERVDDGIYDHLPSVDLSPANIVHDTNPARDTNVLQRLLQDVFTKASPDQRPAVKTIIRTIQELESPPKYRRLSASSPDDKYLDELKRVSGMTLYDPDAYPLANASTRNYTMQMKSSESVETVPKAPMPDNEAQRLRSINRSKLDDVKNIPELEIMCDLARRELGCSTSLVNFVDSQDLHVLASNAPALQNFVCPREQALCAHTVMSSDQPLLVPHPEADVRFSRQDVVRNGGVRFYLGFPITSSDGSAIGTLCCMDEQSHTVTQSQYQTMERLARSTSKIVQHHLGKN